MQTVRPLLFSGPHYHGRRRRRHMHVSYVPEGLCGVWRLQDRFVSPVPTPKSGDQRITLRLVSNRYFPRGHGFTQNDPTGEGVDPLKAARALDDHIENAVPSHVGDVKKDPSVGTLDSPCYIHSGI